MLGSIKRWGLIVLLSSTAAAAMADSAVACEPVDGIESICGLQNPEDLVVAPNGRDILFSQFSEDGSLAVLDTHNHSVHLLYPGSDSTITSGELWGEPACKTPGQYLTPHGIDLRRRGDGRWQLLVVNHAGRESVEFFEVIFGEADRPRLVWRGCVVMPEQGNINDVAGLPDGGFLVTQMADMDYQMWQLFLVLLGVDSGFVYRWGPDSGFSQLQGTQGKMPNGILLSPDGQHFFLNLYFGNELRKYDLASGELLAAVDIEKPDNLSWSPGGKLLVASQHASLIALLKSLDAKDSGPSMLPFSIFEVDPNTLEKRLLLRRDGPPMGAGTVAVEVDGQLYIGSYAGDRMIKMAVAAGQ